MTEEVREMETKSVIGAYNYPVAVPFTRYYGRKVPRGEYDRTERNS